MVTNRTYLYFFRQFIDYICIIISFFLAKHLSTEGIEHVYNNSANEILLLLLLLLTWYFSTNTSKLYDEFRSRNLSYEINILLKNILIQFAVTIILIFLIKEIQFSRLFVLYYIFNLLALLIIQKLFLNFLLILLRLKGRNLRSILIIGAGEVGMRFFDSIKENPQFGYKVVGFLDDFEIPMSEDLYLGSVNSLNKILLEKEIDNVIVALPNYASEKIHHVINICERNGKVVRVIPDYFRFASSRYSVSMFGQFPVIAVKEEKIDTYFWRLVKRVFDIAFSSIVIIILLLWLFPVVALLIIADTRGPVIFKQERWGRNNKKFIVYKFRTMRCESKDIDANGKFCQATQNDSRITKLGRFLRKTNIDELLQFINVLKGEMSVVGPRPHPTPLNMESLYKIDYYLKRHFVKPGITGWAQVHGLRGETSDIALMEKRVEYDLWYIENWSLLLDIQIVFMTIWNMLKGDPNAY
ncbi:MAG: undecaprenyl-phosphate glucose phosphotransferase [Elusimicrobiota bacterium]